MPDDNVYQPFAEIVKPPTSPHSKALQSASGNTFAEAFDNAPIEELAYECRKRLDAALSYYNSEDKAAFDELFYIVSQAGNTGGPHPGSKDEFAFCKEFFQQKLSNHVNELLRIPPTPGKPEPDITQLIVLVQQYCKRVADNPNLTNMSKQGNQQALSIAGGGAEVVAGPIAGVVSPVVQTVVGVASAAKTAYDTSANLSAGDKKKSLWQRFKDNIGAAWSDAKKTVGDLWAAAKNNPVKAVLASIGIAGVAAVTVLFAPIVVPILGITYGGAKVAKKAHEFHAANQAAYNRLQQFSTLMGPEYNIQPRRGRDIEVDPVAVQGVNQLREEMLQANLAGLNDSPAPVTPKNTTPHDARDIRNSEPDDSTVQAINSMREAALQAQLGDAFSSSRVVTKTPREHRDPVVARSAAESTLKDAEKLKQDKSSIPSPQPSEPESLTAKAPRLGR